MKSPQYDKTLLKSVSEDVFISANVEIRRPHLISIGSHIAIDSGFYITTRAKMGDYIHIGPYVSIIGGADACISIGNFVNLTVGAKIICGSDSFSGDGLVTAPGIPEKLLNKKIFTTVSIEDFASVCAGAIVMPGVIIAEGSVIGANSLVAKNTEPWTVYAGNPAKPIKSRPKEIILASAKKLGY